MNFILFNVLLLAAGFLALLIFSVGVMTCLAPLALISKSEHPPRALLFPLMGVAGIFQVYFWGLWAAFCVAMTMNFTQKPEVTWDWLYWIAGFMESTSLIGWLAHKEQQSSQSLAVVQGIQRGTMLYSLVGIVGFLSFAFNPALMELPYGWALRSFGIVNPEPFTSVVKTSSKEKEYLDHQYQFAF